MSRGGRDAETLLVAHAHDSIGDDRYAASRHCVSRAVLIGEEVLPEKVVILPVLHSAAGISSRFAPRPWVEPYGPVVEVEKVCSITKDEVLDSAGMIGES